ncbi:MAG TPA: hypothetical protein VNA17_00395 [Pyrinomonadaceae bacterium]|nr:hypothetical protein [Pyrinomonadaceae bacterium]
MKLLFLQMTGERASRSPAAEGTLRAQPPGRGVLNTAVRPHAVEDPTLASDAHPPVVAS